MKKLICTAICIMLATGMAAQISINGPATPAGNWETDYYMTQHAENPDLWGIDIYLTTGEVKFRQDGNWDVNWGGTTFPEGIGYQDGPNIFVTQEGNYYVTLNTSTGAYQFSIFTPGSSGITHQAVIRNAANELVTNQSIGVRASVIRYATNGPVVYSETHNPTSNANGLITFVIGHGTGENNFSEIDWADGPYFLKTEADPEGGTNYSISGTAQLLSVPYALHAGSAGDNQWEQSWGNIFSRNPGNVGIGSQYPNSRLFVTGWASNPAIPSAVSQGILRLGIIQEGGIDIGKIDTAPFSMWMQAGWNGEATDPISLQPLGGDIGIGTLIPEAQLHTTGSVRFEGAGTPGEGKILTSNENGLATWQPPTSGSNWISDENDIYRETGNVGIGVEQPEGKLHVSVPGEWLGVVFTGTGPDDLDVDISAYNGIGATAYAVRIENTGPVPNMVETSNDGGTTWSVPIPIAPDIDMGYGVIVNFGSTSGYNYDDRWDWTVNESFEDVLVVKDDRVGIGITEPAQKLHVNGNVFIPSGRSYWIGNDAGAGNRLRMHQVGTNAYIDWGEENLFFRSGVSGSTNRVVFTGAGNVGVGTTAPTQKLDINGQIRIRGGSPGEGRVLTSNANGTASWQDATTTINSAMGCVDIDGNAYPTIVIENQVWMAENLRVTKYRNGQSISHVTGDAAWGALTSGAYCWYDNNQSANAKYGALYNWYAVNDPRCLCPEGWRVPTDAEWTAFTNMLGGSSVAGGKLKAVSPLWDSPNTDATNSTGFSALPGGLRWSDGSFSQVSDVGYWWSATEISGANAWYRMMNSYYGGVFRHDSNKTFGFSVRCLRDN